MFPSVPRTGNAPSPFTNPSNLDIEGDKDDMDGYILLGLYILSLNELSLAIIMKRDAMSDKEHIKKCLKLSTEAKLPQLETDLEMAYLGSGPIHLSNARIVTPQSQSGTTTQQSYPYHMLAFDDLTKIATCTPVTTQSEMEFVQGASHIHDSFMSTHSSGDISQMIVKDSSGEIFAKRAFGREVYFQHKNGGNISHDKFLEGVEKTLRTTLKDDHNINML